MKKKVLIVDDEPNIIVPLQFLMEQNGYDVMVAATGEEAMEAIAANKPDLILLDIMLPGIDGYQVCQTIRANADWPEIKIVFISAMGRDVDVAKGLALAADAYITKPFAIADVVAKVNRLLNAEDGD
ncbi:MAG: response regulator [Desulfosarcinaceae bacterium]|jgi:DNA-binding response OmpR family regulator